MSELLGRVTWRSPDSMRMPAVVWCAESRQDPITGLVAFPDFHHMLPGILEDCRQREVQLGLAIGDVDDLKHYVEESKSSDPAAFGHVAGCGLMQSLGTLAVRWFEEMDPQVGCLATFGGDEIIVALPVQAGQEGDFVERVGSLRDLLGEGLPRTVSFGCGVLPVSDLHRSQAAPDPDEVAVRLLSAIDCALFRSKKAARAAGVAHRGQLAEVQISV